MDVNSNCPEVIDFGVKSPDSFSFIRIKLQKEFASSQLKQTNQLSFTFNSTRRMSDTDCPSLSAISFCSCGVYAKNFLHIVPSTTAYLSPILRFPTTAGKNILRKSSTFRPTKEIPLPMMIDSKATSVSSVSIISMGLREPMSP